MTIRDDLPSLYAYTRWADARMMAAARRLTPEQYVQEPAPGWTSVRASVIHMGGAMWLWSLRLSGEPIAARPTEDEFPTFDDAERLLRQGHDAIDRLIAEQTPERLATIWEARDPRGQLRRIPYWAAYRHIANHQSYHRGQVASKLRGLGVEPPVTDLVLWAIEQVPQP